MKRNRLLTWILRLAALLLLVVGGLVGYVYTASARQMARTYTVSVPPLTIPDGCASLEGGKYQFHPVAMCVEWQEEDLGGKAVTETFPMGRLVAASLTRERDGIGASSSH